MPMGTEKQPTSSSDIIAASHPLTNCVWPSSISDHYSMKWSGRKNNSNGHLERTFNPKFYLRKPYEQIGCSLTHPGVLPRPQASQSRWDGRLPTLMPIWIAHIDGTLILR